MALASGGESLYTKSVKDLIRRIHDATPVRDSFYEIAADYFKQEPLNQAQLLSIETKIANAEETLAKTSRKQVQHDLMDEIKGFKIQLKNLRDAFDEERIKRRNKLMQICFDILELIDGANFTEENTKAAKLLGTIFMIQPDEGRRRFLMNMRAKHLYKACLSLRLLDRLLSSDLIKDPYVKHRCDAHKQADDANALNMQTCLRDEIKMPLLMAAIMQDIGRMHPEAQRILHGPDKDLSEFRTLTPLERSQLLQISYTQSLRFAIDAIGEGRYVGNSRTERDEFAAAEKDKLKFIVRVMKSAINGKDDLGDLIKIPQVYASVVLSTKESHKLEQTPLVMMILKRGAEDGKFSRTGVAALLSIVGIFPQGFGVAYIPAENGEQDRYEYGIVNGLYPSRFDEPVCRRVTRNLQYYPNGNNVVITRQYNLFFPDARKKLDKIPRERLLDILEKLCFDFEERKNQDLIPRCWHPYHYFADERHQHLWARGKIDSN